VVPLGRWLGRVLLGSRSAGVGRAGRRVECPREVWRRRLDPHLVLGRDGPAGDRHRADADDGRQGEDRDQRDPGGFAQAASGESTRAHRDTDFGGDRPRGER
jgi:hypothetical protein